MPMKVVRIEENYLIPMRINEETIDFQFTDLVVSLFV